MHTLCWFYFVEKVNTMKISSTWNRDDVLELWVGIAKIMLNQHLIRKCFFGFFKFWFVICRHAISSRTGRMNVSNLVAIKEQVEYFCKRNPSHMDIAASKRVTIKKMQMKNNCWIEKLGRILAKQFSHLNL